MCCVLCQNSCEAFYWAMDDSVLAKRYFPRISGILTRTEVKTVNNDELFWHNLAVPSQLLGLVIG